MEGVPLGFRPLPLLLLEKWRSPRSADFHFHFWFREINPFICSCHSSQRSRRVFPVSTGLKV